MHDKDGDCFDHHLMFYLGDALIFKVWLKNSAKDKPFENIKKALASVRMKIVS